MCIDDKQVIFQGVYLMDKFYSEHKTEMPSSDLQLTAVTALFIASKNLEVDPLDLKTCVETLCYNKFSRSQFLDKEVKIRKVAAYENESPCPLDYVMIFVRMLKIQVVDTLEYSDATVNFLVEIQTIAYDVAKSTLIDASMLKYPPSLLGMAMIIIGFQLEFETGVRRNIYSLDKPEGVEQVAQICQCFRLLIEIFEREIGIDLQEVITFSDNLLDRQIMLYDDYKAQWTNVYKQRVAEYFVKTPKRSLSKVPGGINSRT